MIQRFVSFVLAVFCAWSMDFGSTLHATEAESRGRLSRERSHLASTEWLSNGARIVRLRSESQPDLVSICLIVEGGPEGLPSSRQVLPHLVEHLAFHKIEEWGDGHDWIRQVGGFVHAYTRDNQVVHGFDVPARHASRVLATIRSQWDADSFATSLFERETRRIRHERWNRGDNYLSVAAHALAPGTPLDRLGDAELAALDSANAETAWAFFQETYVGSRLTLTVAASATVLPSLAQALSSFGDIPAGTPWPGSARREHLQWLQGSVVLPEPYSFSAFGVRFEVPESISPSHRLFLRNAVQDYMQHELALRSGTVYDFDVTANATRDTEIWVFDAQYSSSLLTGADLLETANQVLRLLGTEEAMDWWKDRLTGWSISSIETRLDPNTLTTTAAQFVEILPHDAVLPPGLGWAPPSPQEAMHMAALALDAAIAFNFRGTGYRRDWSELEFDEDMEFPALVSLAWLVDDACSNWSGVAFFILLQAFFQYVVYLLIRDLARWARRSHRGISARRGAPVRDGNALS